MQKILLFGSALLSALPVWAQQVATPAGASAQAAPAYRSVFDDYRAWRDVEPLRWRNANDDAAALGGHMGHLRGASAPRSSTQTSTVPAPMPGMDKSTAPPKPESGAKR
jgi:hypothetical protein